MADALPQPQLSYSLGMSLRGPVETSLREMLSGYGWEPEVDLLDAILRLKDILTAFGLEAVPPLGSGGLDTPRVVRLEHRPDALGLALSEIEAGEGARIEFKSTLLLNVKQWEMDPKPDLKQCRSDKVIKSAIKTLAAYMNTSGGVLLIGIADDGSWHGLSDDFILANNDKPDFDAWELEFRRLVEKHFGDNSANSYISISKIEKDGKVAARVEVAERKGIVFLKAAQLDELYIRSDNRSIPVNYCNICEFFEIRKLYA